MRTTIQQLAPVDIEIHSQCQLASCNGRHQRRSTSARLPKVLLLCCWLAMNWLASLGVNTSSISLTQAHPDYASLCLQVTNA